MHTNMLKGYQAMTLPRRLYKAFRRELTNVYGNGWGDPETASPLMWVRDHWLLDYVRPDQTALEIGPGGGRWTRYLLGFKQVYAVDYHQELLDQLKKNFNKPNVTFVKNNGTDFPSVPDASIDFLFTFGVFVHLDNPIIEAYLENMKRILKPGANAVIQYSDKRKILAQRIEGFADNDPDRMRAMVEAAGFTIVEEDLHTMWHSSIIRFTH
jgi:SAM-dependent methyltransferase